ncbi:GNAT family N-acetyltransferase [Amycolatopsis thermophila]|uniref:Aminoglycoside 2'-N-acetyltransferase I n=1 Tax=Amycolatopsis thermophila TaxID=206084 RepID=A0ABU0ENE8_9PSEU|nr:GNAT family N-acetyltransferase [Amycolatopsis thermophila]MDQ0376818.1 aminoglycoside 2'-N-acetyltransferase I [Amycolatopsis thermophila]
MAEVTLQVAHTADLGARALAAARDLLYDVFEGDITEHDWEHALGGVHALLWEGGEPVAHGSVVQRRLLCDGRAWRAGYVEAVGVRADRRRRGYGAAVMEPLERVVHEAYEFGALAATDEAIPFYRGRGWACWRGPLSALTPSGLRATPEEAGGVLVLGLPYGLTPDAELTCDWRDGDVW